MRLRHFYDVRFYEADYYVQDQVFRFDLDENQSTIIKVFPIKDYKKIDSNKKKEIHTYGVLYINKNNELYKMDGDTVFKYIPRECNAVTFSKKPIPIDVNEEVYNTKETIPEVYFLWILKRALATCILIFVKIPRGLNILSEIK